jgi:hypothetical protein
VGNRPSPERKYSGSIPPYLLFARNMPDSVFTSIFELQPMMTHLPVPLELLELPERYISMLQGNLEIISRLWGIFRTCEKPEKGRLFQCGRE